MLAFGDIEIQIKVIHFFSQGLNHSFINYLNNPCWFENNHTLEKSIENISEKNVLNHKE